MIILRQKEYSEKESWYRRFQRKFDTKVEKVMEKNDKRVDAMKEGSLKDFLSDMSDPKKNRFHYKNQLDRNKEAQELDKISNAIWEADKDKTEFLGSLGVKSKKDLRDGLIITKTKTGTMAYHKNDKRGGAWDIDNFGGVSYND